MLTLALLIASFLLNRWFARLVTRPIRKLLMLMNRVKQGDLGVRFSPTSHDEIGILGSRFDEMLMQIQQLLSQVVEEGNAKQRAEMRALQAQINPHFLYNTLDELYWRFLELNDKTASDMILSLSRFFRLSLNKGEEETTVAKEFEHVEQYLKLIKYQYSRQFTYEVTLDERCQSVRIPKIILQPLVENSILHAFKTNEYQQSWIHVTGKWHEPNVLVMSVEDNGSGMARERVEQFNRSEDLTHVSDSQDEGGYAIPNIKERLKYYYGTRASLHIESELGQGTAVEIRITVEPKEEQQ